MQVLSSEYLLIKIYGLNNGARSMCMDEIVKEILVLLTLLDYECLLGFSWATAFSFCDK